MKLLVLLSVAAVAVAAPRYDNDNSSPNAYKFSFDLSDGTRRAEDGQLNNVGTDNELLRVTGSYTWVGPDGVEYTVTYTADENGIQIQQGPGGGVPAGVVASLLGG